jgi:Tol biopolymer transport system component
MRIRFAQTIGKSKLSRREFLGKIGALGGVVGGVGLLSYSAAQRKIAAAQGNPSLHFPGEKHLAKIRQLTFGGENAEGYFNTQGDKIIFQSTRDAFSCDQIFSMHADGSNVKLLSTGLGRTTCAFFIPGTDEFIYASTHTAHPDCPTPPDRSKGYVWKLFDTFDIYRNNMQLNSLVRLTHSPGYDAEGAVSPDGKKIVFTSTRDGDPEIYVMNSDGTEQRRLTYTVGYDGGPFFSPKGNYIVYRSSHPKSPAEFAQYHQLITTHLVSPMILELWIMDADGGNQRQVTDLRAASFGPYMHPDEERIIFSSNYGWDRASGQMPIFNLYMINKDGSGLEQITFNPTFDGFPMFSYDGKKLIWASNRHAKIRGETNLFLADWID